MTGQTTILPCPFCGKSKVVIEQFGLKTFACSCEDTGCMVIGPEAPTREEAAAKWNACKREPVDHG